MSRAPTANTTTKVKPPSPSVSEATERGGTQDAGTSWDRTVYPHDRRGRTNSSEQYADARNTDGVETPPRPPKQQRERSQSRVRFNLDNNTEHSPEIRRRNHINDKQQEEDEDGSGSARTKKKRSRRRERDDNDESDGETNERSRRRPSSSSKSKKDKYEREEPEDGDSSDGTVELPPRFDKHGDRLRDDDPLANTLHKFLGQAGFTDFLSHLGGGNDENDDRRGRGDGGARHRHRH